VSRLPLRIVVVVANWNGGDENLPCVASILAQGVAPADVVFVDNGSTDGSCEAVKVRFPGLTIVRNPTNLGFGEASNQGARLALERGADAVFFVNNDLELPDGALAALAQALVADRRLGVVGPRVLYKREPERVWCAGGMLTWRENLSTLLGHREQDAPIYRERRAVDYIPGCALLIRRTALEKIGLFDAQFFAYMEDVDLCLRASEAGFGVRLIGDVAVYHSASIATGGGYNPRRKYMMGVNSIWFLRRHARAAQWTRFWIYDVLTLPILWAIGLFRGRSKAVLAKGLGIIDGLRGKRVTAESIQEGAGWLW
jgi:GT2 family glycosyltransferase